MPSTIDPSSASREQRSVPTPIDALLRVAGLAEEKRAHLFDYLGTLRPSTVEITSELQSSLVRAARVSPKTATAAIHLTSIANEILTDPEFDSFLAVAARWSGNKFTPEVLRAVLISVQQRTRLFSEHMDVLSDVQSAMATIVSSSVACSLRKLETSNRLVPVALVRLVIDESGPIVFQALPQHLLQIKAALDAALSELSTLSVIAKSVSGQSEETPE